MWGNNVQSITISSPFENEIRQRYTHIQIVREMGWTVQQLYDTPKDFLDDMIQVMNIESARQTSQINKQKKKHGR